MPETSANISPWVTRLHGYVPDEVVSGAALLMDAFCAGMAWTQGECHRRGMGEVSLPRPSVVTSYKRPLPSPICTLNDGSEILILAGHLAQCASIPVNERVPQSGGPLNPTSYLLAHEYFFLAGVEEAHHQMALHAGWVAPQPSERTWIDDYNATDAEFAALDFRLMAARHIHCSREAVTALTSVMHHAAARRVQRGMTPLNPQLRPSVELLRSLDTVQRGPSL